ncbi:heptaprenyl diphosphate synthase [Proteiniborus ethanoligenes]|uniref:Heptaprenyl diphosphate synthase n=1 Tax=Proteiniborus ethanoligenes TaxID=415015 RepID=A0A1H3SGW3_9FIRM|nr:Gx transporter family protein [Proteiniborus ethanoligenes]TAH63593.1 MAG: Gx transporter family protein [Gottschalkiaceae bacterium]SDZ36977.1 heptaprenyl diphosphate synthase [Proteiniborus ethanoligenes]
MTRLRKIVFISLLVSLGLALSIIESMIPLPIPLPGMKLGLANIVCLVTLVIFGYKEAFVVAILRTIAFALATGSFSGLIYSFSGAILSTLAMTIVFKYLSNYFSLIGVSIFGAIFHNAGQLLAASLIMENLKIFSYFPFMTILSLFTGYFVGLSSILITNNMRKILGET